MFNTRPCPGLSTPCPSPYDAVHMYNLFCPGQHSTCPCQTCPRHACPRHACPCCAFRITSDMPAVAIRLKRVLQRHVDAVKSAVSQSENWHVAKNYCNSHMPIVASDTRTSCPLLLKCTKMYCRVAELITRDTPLFTIFFWLYTYSILPYVNYEMPE